MCNEICKKLVISTAINYDSTNNQMIVALPEGIYECNCILFAQTLPTSATLTANVVFTIGDGVTRYPMVTKCCTPVQAAQVRSGHIYRVKANTTSGVFRYAGNICLPERVGV